MFVNQYKGFKDFPLEVQQSTNLPQTSKSGIPQIFGVDFGNRVAGLPLLIPASATR
jgi:hypothetical protein